MGGSLHAEVGAGEEESGEIRLGVYFAEEVGVGRRSLYEEVGLAQGTGWGMGGVHTGSASPSARASLHSKLISNRKGLWKGLGFSSTATFSTDTLAIASPGGGSSQGWGGASDWVLSGQPVSAAHRPPPPRSAR